MIQDMQLHGHSEATQKAYLRTVRQLNELRRNETSPVNP